MTKVVRNVTDPDLLAVSHMRKHPLLNAKPGQIKKIVRREVTDLDSAREMIAELAVMVAHLHRKKATKD